VESSHTHAFSDGSFICEKLHQAKAYPFRNKISAKSNEHLIAKGMTRFI